MGKLIYFAVTLFLFGSGVMSILDENEEFKEMSDIETFGLFASGETLAPRTPHSYITDVSKWDSLLVGKWEYYHVYTRPRKSGMTFEGTVEYFPDGKFRRRVKGIRHRAASPRRNDLTDIYKAFGGSISGTYSFEERKWLEHRTKCNSSDSKNYDICSIIDNPWSFGAYETDDIEQSIVVFTDDRIVIKGFNYSKQQTFRYEFNKVE